MAQSTVTTGPDKTGSINDSDEARTNWRSVYIAAVLSFVGSVQFSLFFSVLWPYLQIIDPTANETFFGFIVAVYSVGQVISAPIFGYWSNKIGQVRIPLYVGFSLMIMGNLCYIFLETVNFPRRFFMLIGRLITGAGSGNVTLLRAYASTASTLKDRPRAIACVTCGQALGNTAGPLFQLFFTSFTYPGWKIFGSVSINMYTAPAYFACLMNICGIIALKFLFKEKYAGIAEGNPMVANNIKNEVPMYDFIAFGICCMTRFTQMFVNTNLETLGSPLSMMMFNWSEKTAVTLISAAQGVVGILTLATYVVYAFFKLDRFISSRIACMLSLASLIMFHIVTYSWPFIPGHVKMHHSSTSDSNDTNADNVGCNVDKFNWCESLRPVNIYLYYIVYVVTIGIAYPMLNITVATLLSKILGPRPQGTQQGIFQASGSLSRVVGPIGVSTLYVAFGPRMAWILEIVVISVTLFSWIIGYKRMIPLQMLTTNIKPDLDEPTQTEVSRRQSIFDGV